MKLNESKILSMVQKIKQGEAAKEELKELLGGDKLYEIFAKDTVETMIEQIINLGKIHSLIKENGFDILEGLLNKKIVGNLSSFYCIKPEYIISLPKEEQEKMATCIAGNWKELQDMLVFLWGKGIMTEAVTTNLADNDPMIQLRILEDDLDAQKLIQKIYEHEGIEISDNFYYLGRFKINLIGKDLYTYCSEDEIEKNRKSKKDVFEETRNNKINELEVIFQSMTKDAENIKQQLDDVRNFKLKLQKAGNDKFRKLVLTEENELIQDLSHITNKDELEEVIDELIYALEDELSRKTKRAEETRKEIDKLKLGREKSKKKEKSWELTSEEKARIAENSIGFVNNIRENGQELDGNGTNDSRNVNDQQKSDEQEV